MLSKEDNEALTRTGPDTSGGKLLRQYWQPVAMLSDLPENGAPLPLKVMDENLVLFRDEHNQLGLLGQHCPHRRADLSYGRVEGGGLRCLYHGWVFDVHGQCLEQPAEPHGKSFCQRVKHIAYPVQTTAGMVFAYMGGGEPPVPPDLECRGRLLITSTCGVSASVAITCRVSKVTLTHSISRSCIAPWPVPRRAMLPDRRMNITTSIRVGRHASK